MKVYRCIIACLMLTFIAIGVWYFIYALDEQRSTAGGTLIWRVEDVTGDGLY